MKNTIKKEDEEEDEDEEEERGESPRVKGKFWFGLWQKIIYGKGRGRKREWVNNVETPFLFFYFQT